jgi:uncharacterized protein DUF4886
MTASAKILLPTGVIHLRSGVTGLLLFCLSSLALSADDILFIGNSFTFGEGDAQVKEDGGVPKLVEAIATAKGKSAITGMVTTGGKDWGFHLANPATDTALKSKPWGWVVIQDYSTKATHVGNVDEFMKNGEAFSDRIAQESPQAKIVLYETWALDARNPIFTGTSDPKHFANPGEMIGEIIKNYTSLQTTLQARDSTRQVALAPVGEAFSRCHQEHPEINLNAKDLKHASQDGSYLSALVIYATLFHDSPKGATRTFPGFTVDANESDSLQAVAAEVTAGK